MPDSNKWSEAVKQLAAQTESGEIGWWESNAITRDDADGPIYEATLLNRKIVCYKYCYCEENTSSGADNSEPVTGVAIEFVQPATGNLQWRLPETPNHYALLDAIRYRASGAADFLTQFLKNK